MTEIDFYRLPRAIQDGLLDAFRGELTPAPILTRPGARPIVLGWAAVSYTAALGLLALCVAGYGAVESALALQPKPVAGAYMLLAATSILGGIQALAWRARLKALPFGPGVFLFPAGVIDARDHRLRVYPLAGLLGVAAGGRSLIARFRGRSFSFPLADASRAHELVRAVEAARDRMRAQPDAAERRRLDPLEPPAVESPLASPIPLSRSAPPWEQYGVFLAIAAGAVVGVGLYLGRNLLSDDRMFAEARARDDVASYKAYAGRGRRHLEEVSQVLLPRAELRLAVADGSVEAVDAFLREHPRTGIQAEVDAARRAALVAELERTRKEGTLAALLSFAERYPDHGLTKEHDESKHALYARALARYKAEMAKGGEKHAELVGRLLAYAERVGPKRTPEGLRGPAVEVRFRQLPSRDMDRADALVRKSPTFNGAASLPSRYITAAALEPNEQRAAQALAEGLAKGFDPEILTFAPGRRLDGAQVGAGAEALPAVTAPTLLVSYRVESSGAAQSRTRPRGIFLGLMFYFNADFILPGDAQPLRVQHQLVQRLPTDILNKQKGAPPPGVVEALVYEAMMRDAFVQLRERHLAKWFRPQPQPRKEGGK